jgi:hypothetical protein
MSEREAAAIVKLSDTQFVSFFAEMSCADAAPWMGEIDKLIRSKRSEEEREPINAKVRALVAYRVKELKTFAPEFFY